MKKIIGNKTRIVRERERDEKLTAYENIYQLNKQRTSWKKAASNVHMLDTGTHQILKISILIISYLN